VGAGIRALPIALDYCDRKPFPCQEAGRTEADNATAANDHSTRVIHRAHKNNTESAGIRLLKLSAESDGIFPSFSLALLSGLDGNDKREGAEDE
jgi:hypothetical protein